MFKPLIKQAVREAANGKDTPFRLRRYSCATLDPSNNDCVLHANSLPCRWLIRKSRCDWFCAKMRLSEPSGISSFLHVNCHTDNPCFRPFNLKLQIDRLTGPCLADSISARCSARSDVLAGRFSTSVPSVNLRSYFVFESIRRQSRREIMY